MMTVVMDRTLTAPAPPDARSPGVPASDGRTSRAPVPFGGPVRRLVAGIAVGAAAMLGVAVLDSVADTTVPVLGSFAALPERAGGPEVLGYWHSHPSGSPEPSATDRAQAPGDGRVWAIIAPDGSGGTIGWWRDAPGGFVPLSYTQSPR